MSEFNIKVDGGSSVRLPTAGKYCDRDIVVTSVYNDLDYDDLEFWSAYFRVRQIRALNLPRGITALPGRALYGWSVFSVTLPEGLIKLDVLAVGRCTSLQSIKLPDSLEEIGYQAFYENTQLTSVLIPSKVREIGEYAFYNCTNLKSVTFKGTPTTIYGKAFSGCSNLRTINVPWAEGKVANAPWGATNATINYNYKEEQTDA